MEELYPEKDYPYLKYFVYTKYRTVDDLKKPLDSKEDHPLLFNYLNDSEGARKLKYLYAFNEFSNYMTEKYSYKISREEAKKTKLSKEKENIPKEIKDNFMDAWNHIYEDCKIYKFRAITPKKLTENDELINFLIDDNETAYLPAAYHNFIIWQNNFLKKIIESAKSNDNLNYYVDNMKIEIPLQEATQNQILLIDECFKNSIYDNFDDLIYSFSKRDIFDKKEMIENINYNSYKFEISSLEEELGKLILPEKCMFEGEENLNFVTFYGEGFRGGKSGTLRKFYSKYPQKDLDDNEKEYIQEQISKISPEKESKEKYKSLFSSTQLIIFYLANNDFNDEEEIKRIIEKNERLNIDTICKNFFASNNKFKANQLMNVFFFIEDLFFENLRKSVHKDYKTKIEDNKTNEIENKLVNNIKEEDKDFIKDLSSALRRFISRYLLGEGQFKDIDENSLLEYELRREDLWEEKYQKLDLDKLIYEKIKDFKLKVGEALSFYEIIGKEDKKAIEESKNKINAMKNNESQKVTNVKSEPMKKEEKDEEPKDGNDNDKDVISEDDYDDISDDDKGDISDYDNDGDNANNNDDDNDDDNYDDNDDDNDDGDIKKKNKKNETLRLN